MAFFANMGERFGFYTMMAILVLFLQAKFGLAAERAGDIYSWFYFFIYALSLVGGIIADATKKYTAVIAMGQVIMFIGYAMMVIPGLSLPVTVIGLFTIAVGNGFFKGNLQAVVGQLYDDPKYDKVRDNAFLIFYMGINVGRSLLPLLPWDPELVAENQWIPARCQHPGPLSPVPGRDPSGCGRATATGRCSESERTGHGPGVLRRFLY